MMDEDALWKAVLEVCEVGLKETFGRSWKEVCAGLGARDHDLEREARVVYSKLKAAIKEAVAFTQSEAVKEHPWPEMVTRALCDWVPETIEPLQKYSWLFPPAGSADLPELLNHRAHIVRTLDRYNVFGVERPDGRSRFLTVREMAMVSLLAGNRPKLKGNPLNWSPAEIIRREATYIRPLLKRHGMPGVKDEDRGGPVRRRPADPL